MIDWIISKAKESSTWVGIVGTVCAFGASQNWFTVSPEQQELIVKAILGIMGVVLVFITEQKKAE